jgi:hypothetical protein
MKGKIALEEHVSTAENNRVIDANRFQELPGRLTSGRRIHRHAEELATSTGNYR